MQGFLCTIDQIQGFFDRSLHVTFNSYLKHTISDCRRVNLLELNASKHLLDLRTELQWSNCRFQAHYLAVQMKCLKVELLSSIEIPAKAYLNWDSRMVWCQALCVLLCMHDKEEICGLHFDQCRNTRCMLQGDKAISSWT